MILSFVQRVVYVEEISHLWQNELTGLIEIAILFERKEAPGHLHWCITLHEAQSENLLRL